MAFIKRKDKDIDLKSVCSCGKVGYECDFWNTAEKTIKNEKDYNKAYLKLIDYFFDKYGDATILVDSSKNTYKYLKMVDKEFDLKIIYLSRDFRSWAFSRHLRTKKTVFIKMIHWFLENKKLIYSLKSMNLNYLTVGYEELAIYPEFVLKRICKFINENYEAEMLNPSATKSHIIAGNIVRADKEKRAKITYDARWLTSSKIIFNSIFFSFFFKFNKKLVYSNVLNKKLEPESFAIFDIKSRKEAEKKYN